MAQENVGVLATAMVVSNNHVSMIDCVILTCWLASRMTSLSRTLSSAALRENHSTIYSVKASES